MKTILLFRYFFIFLFSYLSHRCDVVCWFVCCVFFFVIILFGIDLDSFFFLIVCNEVYEFEVNVLKTEQLLKNGVFSNVFYLWKSCGRYQSRYAFVFPSFIFLNRTAALTNRKQVNQRESADNWSVASFLLYNRVCIHSR